RSNRRNAMLTELRLEKTKSFISENVLPFTGLSVLTGVNSSGKSTAFQAILLLKQAFEAPPMSVAGMQLNGRYVTVGSYEDWSSIHNRENFRVAVKIGLNSKELRARHDFARVVG